MLELLYKAHNYLLASNNYSYISNTNFFEKNMQYITIIFRFLILSFILSSCNSMEGLGKDIKRGGEKLEKSANDNK